MWWARRPLASCRAVLCAALWPDPADSSCPLAFRTTASSVIAEWVSKNLSLGSAESYSVYREVGAASALLGNPLLLQQCLLTFIADFCDWDNARDIRYFETARKLTRAAHEALGGLPGTLPTVVDPFAGGGAIPLEAVRVGAEVFASDLNPIPVLLNSVAVVDVPRYGKRLLDEFSIAANWFLAKAIDQLAEFYPASKPGNEVVAYLWARTLTCGGPGCGIEIPLITDPWVAKKKGIAIQISVNDKNISTKVVHRPKGKMSPGTVKTGSISCPRCGFTMSSATYRARALHGELGERLYAVIEKAASGVRIYRDPAEGDIAAFNRAKARLLRQLKRPENADLVPTEELSAAEPRRLNVLHYGFKTWGELFNARQTLSLTALSKLVAEYYQTHQRDDEPDFWRAVATLLGLCVSNIAQYNSNVSTYLSDGMISVFIQSSSVPMRANYAEANPLMSKLVGGFAFQVDRTKDVLENLIESCLVPGSVAQRSADQSILPHGSVQALATDPPYYFAIPYAELSDFFYVWLKRSLKDVRPDLFASVVTPKAEEAIQNLPHSAVTAIQKDRAHFERKITQSLVTAREELAPEGIGVIVFAHASTEGWEAMIKSLLDAQWVITASWPIDTERGGRMLASRQRALASSIHLVCRPRQSMEQGAAIGEWRQVLQELPERIHSWMPRLASEGVVGADAIFACLGPALEIFSRFSRVEKANGEVVTLREFLEQVWAAVAKEALTMIFQGANTAGLESDARLTAMWLWTLAATGVDALSADDAEGDEAGGESTVEVSGGASRGYMLEFDAARKIAQGLGASLEELKTIVEISGDNARLLSVSERAHYLFGKDEGKGAPNRKKREPQMDMFAAFEQAGGSETPAGVARVERLGETLLDRVHQSMLLFAAGRGEAVKRFLVEGGVGREQRFWSLAQALSALYQSQTLEKRWVDGVLARKRALGF